MPILFVESQYPAHKQDEVVETWLGAIQKYPPSEELFTTLIDTAVKPKKGIGIRVTSAYLIEPGKYEEASAYFSKFMASFFPVEGYTYEFNRWATIEEAMGIVDTPMPER